MTESEWNVYLSTIRRMTEEILCSPGFGLLQVEIQNGEVVFVRPTPSFSFRRDICPANMEIKAGP